MPQIRFCTVSLLLYGYMVVLLAIFPMVLPEAARGETTTYPDGYFSTLPDGIDRTEWVNQYLKYFPQSLRERERYVIILPPVDSAEKRAPEQRTSEKNFSPSATGRVLEIRAGQYAEVQPCGESLFETTYESQILSNDSVSGIDALRYFSLTFGEVDQSILFCSQPRTKRLVFGKSKLIYIENELPIVLYAKPDTRIQYRIWNSPSTFADGQPYRPYYLSPKNLSPKN